VGFPNRHHVERLFRTDVCQSVVYEKSQLPNMLQSQFDSLIADSDAPFLTPRSRSFGCYFSDEPLMPGLFNAEQRSARTGKLSGTIATFAL
jgi:hypothetical protein